MTTRRNFLRTIGIGSASALATRMLGPGVSFADIPTNGSGKNIVLVNLYGGADGLFAFPPIGNRVDVMRQLRPSLYALELDLDNLYQMSPEIAFHPAMSALYSSGDGSPSLVESGEFKLVSNIGVPSPNRSHRIAQQIYSVGQRDYNAADPKGWIARLIDLLQLETYQVWGLGVGMREDFLADRLPLLLSEGLSSFSLKRREHGMGGINETQHAHDTLQRILDLQEGLPEHGQKVVESLKDTNSALSYVSDVRAESTSPYPNSRIGGRLRDVAKLIRVKQREETLKDNVSLYFVADGGYDSHNNLLGFLPSALQRNSEALRAFRNDMRSIGDGKIWNNTVVYFFSEFGRTSAENGGLGTDHGAGNMHFLCGGEIDGAGSSMIEGGIPSIEDLTNQENFLLPQLDFRSVPRRILEWAGLSTTQVDMILPTQSGELTSVGSLFKS